MTKERIQKLCEYIDKNRAKNFPIRNAMLERETDYIRNNYFKMLAVLLQQEDEISGGQENFFDRLLAGVVTDYRIEDYMRQALEITIEEYINFTTACKENALKYRFILDGILLISVEQRREDAYKLLAAFCEALVLNKGEIKYLSEVARSILELDEEAYVVAESKAVTSVPAEIFREYISLISSDCVCSNGELTIFHPTSKSEVTVDALERTGENTAPNIKLINVIADLAEYPLLFNNREKVVLDGCQFTGGSKYPICFNNCEEIEIRNCKFKKFSNRVLVVRSKTKLSVENTKFSECFLSFGDYFCYDLCYSGVIAMKGGVADFDTCIFKECGVVDDSNYVFDGIEFLCIGDGAEYKINKCQFIQCVHKEAKGSVRLEAPMFPSNSQSIDCTFENSTKFC